MAEAFCTLVRVDGTREEKKPANGTDFTLRELQQMVGGYIEIVASDLETLVIGDEEGRLKGKQYNPSISQQYGVFLVGDCVIIKREYMK